MQEGGGRGYIENRESEVMGWMDGWMDGWYGRQSGRQGGWLNVADAFWRSGCDRICSGRGRCAGICWTGMPRAVGKQVRALGGGGGDGSDIGMEWLDGCYWKEFQMTSHGMRSLLKANDASEVDEMTWKKKKGSSKDGGAHLWEVFWTSGGTRGCTLLRRSKHEFVSQAGKAKFRIGRSSIHHSKGTSTISIGATPIAFFELYMVLHAHIYPCVCISFPLYARLWVDVFCSSRSFIFFNLIFGYSVWISNPSFSVTFSQTRSLSLAICSVVQNSCSFRLLVYFSQSILEGYWSQRTFLRMSSWMEHIPIVQFLSPVLVMLPVFDLSLLLLFSYVGASHYGSLCYCIQVN